MVERERPAGAESRQQRSSEKETLGRAWCKEATTEREGSIDCGGRWTVELRCQREGVSPKRERESMMREMGK